MKKTLESKQTFTLTQNEEIGSITNFFIYQAYTIPHLF
jgi:hypothetical protein